MIVVKLWGGLGNQLFEYAYGFAIAKRTGEKLYLDTSWFAKQNLRSPEILKMKIRYDNIGDFSENKPVIRLLNSRIPNILMRIPPFACYKVGEIHYLKESRYRYDERIQKYSIPCSYLDGYWQCPKYFDEIRPELLDMYTPKEMSDRAKEICDNLMNKNSCAIHVRRGDYRKKRRFYSRLQMIGDTYYHDAITLMSQIGCDFYLFSNGIDEASNMIEGITGFAPNVLCKGKEFDALEEWMMMRSCQNQIIGNSTFSWWCAYLNDHDGKRVFAPNKYMGNDNIIPEKWEKLPVE